MRLLTFNTDDGQHRLAALRDDQVIDLEVWAESAGITARARPLGMLGLIEMGEEGLQLARRAVESSSAELKSYGALVPYDTSRLLAPIPRPTKNIVCLGRNYAQHAAESMRAFGETPPAAARPAFPTYFTKAVTAVTAPFGDIRLDFSITEQYDWECELGFVIGRRGKDISRERAMNFVFGYTVVNDISARDVQKRHGDQYFKGKSLDGTCPLGPLIVTRDEISDPGALGLYTRVNDAQKQSSNTREMIFDIPAIIESLSQGMTLEPGDIIATGTPAGIGHAMTPPEYLRPGDVVECEVERVGAIRNRIVGE
jgi:2-keto-4-pentenoate hydratase/2-oxohepta-3-ene-1,7-dioic acid hydratase in catechol pathway